MEKRPGQYRPESEKPKSTDPPKPPQESQERQPGSALSRAVERTRDLYERNGWVFLPLGEAGQGIVSSANTGDAESPEAGLEGKSPVKDSPKRRWRVGAACSGVRIYGEDEGPRVSENKSL